MQPSDIQYGDSPIPYSSTRHPLVWITGTKNIPHLTSSGQYTIALLYIRWNSKLRSKGYGTLLFWQAPAPEPYIFSRLQLAQKGPATAPVGPKRFGFSSGSATLLQSVHLLKLKFYDGCPQLLKRAFDWKVGRFTIIPTLILVRQSHSENIL